MEAPAGQRIWGSRDARRSWKATTSQQEMALTGRGQPLLLDVSAEQPKATQVGSLIWEALVRRGPRVHGDTPSYRRDSGSLRTA